MLQRMRGAGAQVGSDIWSAITSKQALRKPELLTPCVLIVHCDLKRHSYRHRCAFPHLVGATPYMYTDCQRLDSVQGGVRALETAAQQMPAGRAAPVLAMFPTDTGGVEDVVRRRHVPRTVYKTCCAGAFAQRSVVVLFNTLHCPGCANACA